MANDAELLERWRNGDRGAGAALFERYFDRVERFFVNKNVGEIPDLVQETFTALVQRRDRIDDPGKFRQYLFSVAYNVLRTQLRNRYRRDARVDPDLNASSIHDLAPGAATNLGERRRGRLLLEGLRRIPVADQTLLELFYWENLKTAEIAGILDIPRGTVQSRLRAARGRLEQQMKTLADSDEVLQSTLSDLEKWAKQRREALGREEGGEDGGDGEDGDPGAAED